MTGRPLPLTYRLRSKSRDNRNVYRYRCSNKSFSSNSKLYFLNTKFRPPSSSGSPYIKTENYQNIKPNYGSNYSNNSKAQPSNYNRDGNCSRRPFSRNCGRNVRNFINSLLDKEKTDDTTSHTEHTENQSVSEEHFQEEQFNDLVLE